MPLPVTQRRQATHAVRTGDTAASAQHITQAHTCLKRVGVSTEQHTGYGNGREALENSNERLNYVRRITTAPQHPQHRFLSVIRHLMVSSHWHIV